MSYKSLLNSQALKAFNLLKDLAYDAVFEDTSVSGFDFDNLTIEKDTSDPVTIKMVVIETKRKENTITKTVIARLIDTGILDQYDTLTFDGLTWNVGEKVEEVGQVTIFNIYREGGIGG